MNYQETSHTTKEVNVIKVICVKNDLSFTLNTLKVYHETLIRPKFVITIIYAISNLCHCANKSFEQRECEKTNQKTFSIRKKHKFYAEF